ncbi:sodium/proline symporter [Clostridiaceae bacterium NSJ-31]|uniref:Sodium/proline symporter n=1 Tax=Ligaoa zhengdingensis TaxID=2763658 RepID=A0A926I4I7_9FIRM|nr:sodium/proline symporter [Ligaoa zhengdingensis]MBC8546276.1 sodium/proline symporter [Ligaoa zhengdingensis]
MSATTQYIIVIVAYFIAMLGIGFLFNNKVTSDKDYFIAKDKLNAPAIGFSFSATQMSGSTYMGTVGSIRTLGYAFIPAAISSAAAPWFCYVLVGDRIRKVSARLKSVTMADIFEARFGKVAGLLATIIMMVASVPTIAAQLKAAGNSFEVLLGIPYIAALFIFGGIVILYTILGGMFAVAWTDLIQGILMICGFVILLPVVLTNCGGFTAMHEAYAQFNPAGISISGSQPMMWVISGFLVWGFFQVGGQPAATTRFLTTSNEKTLKSALVYSILFESFIFLALAVISIGAGVLLPVVENSDMALPMLIQGYLPPIVGGIVLAAALGAMMSTIDSVLLMVSSLFVNNIYEKYIKKGENAKSGLNAGRITTIVVGVLGLLVAINPPDAVLWIITTGFSLMAAAFTFPLLLGLWWPRTTKAGGLAGIVTGSIACLAWYIAGYVLYGSLSKWIGGIWPAIFGSVISLVVTVVVSLATKPDSKEVLDVFFDDTEVEGEPA